MFVWPCCPAGAGRVIIYYYLLLNDDLLDQIYLVLSLCPSGEHIVCKVGFIMSKFSVRKPLTVFVAVIAVIILGVVAFTRMTPDLFPNMDFPYVMIMTT